MLLDSLIAVFGLILIGYAVKHSVIREEADWRGFERISYFVLVPAVIIHSLANARLADVPMLPVTGALLMATLVVAAALLMLRPFILVRLNIDNPAFTSVFQGALRWNAFIALAIAGSLYGRNGLTLTSLGIAVLIPVLSILTVIVLQRYGSSQSSGLLRGLMTNPFVVSTLVGLALNLSGLKLPNSLMMMIDSLGKGMLGAGLLLVGAGLRFADLQRPSAAMMLSSGVRLLILPLIGGVFGLLFGLSGTPLAVVVICLGVPTASAAYILARQMGGDAPLMAAILTAQTVLAAATLPALLWLFSGL